MNYYLQTNAQIGTTSHQLTAKTHNITQSWRHARQIKIDPTNTITLHIQINTPDPQTINGNITITHNRTNAQKHHTLTTQTITNPKIPTNHTWPDLPLPSGLGTITINATLTPDN